MFPSPFYTASIFMDIRCMYVYMYDSMYVEGNYRKDQTIYSGKIFNNP